MFIFCLGGVCGLGFCIQLSLASHTYIRLYPYWITSPAASGNFKMGAPTRKGCGAAPDFKFPRRPRIALRYRWETLNNLDKLPVSMNLKSLEFLHATRQRVPTSEHLLILLSSASLHYDVSRWRFYCRTSQDGKVRFYSSLLCHHPCNMVGRGERVCNNHVLFSSTL